MFGLLKRKSPIIHVHWYTLVPHLECPIHEFYHSIEYDLAALKVPGMWSVRIWFNEGGIAPQREYLRMQRERLVFDICSAPFGTSWFFSCRLAEIPFVLRLWELLAIFVFLSFLLIPYALVFGIFGFVLFALTMVAVLVLLNTFATTAAQDLDAFIFRIPVLGTVYELFLRRNDSYYREDTRRLYCDTVDAVVRARVEEVLKTKNLSNVKITSVNDPPGGNRLLEKLQALARK